MSLEIRVANEINAYQPKVIWGMSWRQLATVALGLPVVAGVYAAFYLTGHPDAGSWVLVAMVMPLAAYGWVRPKGLAFEQYAKYVWDSTVGKKQRVLYESTPVYKTDWEVVESVDASRKPAAHKAVRRLETR